MFATKMKIAAVLIPMVGIFVAGGMLPSRTFTAEPQEKGQEAPAGRKVPKELLTQQRDAARKVYEQHLVRIKGGQGLLSELFGWSERCLEAELALSDKKEDRIKALKDHMERTREIEGIAIRRAMTGMVMQSDAHAATYDRVRADIRYFQATGKIPPPPPKIKIPRPKKAGKNP